MRGFISLSLFVFIAIQTFAQASAENNEIISDSFENGLGNWIDGGVDCSISTNHSSSGAYCIKLKDNSEQASIYTRALDLEGINEVSFNFKYHCYSMEVNESFILEVSVDGGRTYKILEQWVSGIDFENEKFYSELTSYKYEFSNSTVFRFRCDASSNNDHVYLDQINIFEGKLNSGFENILLTNNSKPANKKSQKESIKIFPNPANEVVSIDLSPLEGLKGSIEIYNLVGSKLSRIIFKEDHPKLFKIPIDFLENGYYSICIRSSDEKLHVMRLMVSK